MKIIGSKMTKLSPFSGVCDLMIGRLVTVTAISLEMGFVFIGLYSYQYHWEALPENESRLVIRNNGINEATSDHLTTSTRILKNRTVEHYTYLRGSGTVLIA